MITGQSLTYALEDGKTTSCEDFSFQDGVTYIPFRQKDVFDTLSFAFSSLSGGSLSVDGVSLAPAGFVGGIAKVIKLNVKDTGSLTLVMFYPGAKEESEKAFGKLASQLKAIRFPVESEEDKKQKLVMLKTVLSLNPISYILIDLNDPLTKKNQTLWELMFLDYQGAAFFLSENSEKAISKAKGEKVPLKKALNLPYRIPLLLTSFLAIFFCAYAQSEKIKLSSKWGLALGAVIVFLIANIGIGVLFAKKVISKETKKEELTLLELIGAASNVIGIAIALLAAWLLSSKMTLLEDGVFKGFGLAMITLLGAVLIFSQLIIDHAVLANRFIKKEEPLRSPQSK